MNLLFLTALILACQSAKILHFAPGLSKSHLYFQYRVARTLKSHGHEVLLFSHLIEPIKNVTPPSGVEEIRYFGPGLNSFVGTFQSRVFSPYSCTNFYKALTKLREVIAEDAIQIAPNLTGYFQKEMFDLALVNMFDMSANALAYAAGIKKTVTVSVGSYVTESMAHALSIPTVPCYLPVFFTKFSDKMDFKERITNVVYEMLTEFNKPIDASYSLLSKLIGTSILNAGLSTSAGGIINGEPYLDFPRPLPPNVFYVGELHQKSEVQDLEEPFKSIMNAAIKGVILMSFGSVANPKAMPKLLSIPMTQALRNLKEYEIIWKFDCEVLKNFSGIEHVHCFDWVPQPAILAHPKLKLFVSHGGYNSLLESSKAGKPLALMPLFGDQYTNAHRAERLGIGKLIDFKNGDFTAEKFENDLRMILKEKRFEINARKLSKMIRDQLIGAEELLAFKLRKIAEAKPSFVEPKVKKLSILQYFHSDVMGMWCTIMCLAFILC